MWRAGRRRALVAAGWGIAALAGCDDRDRIALRAAGATLPHPLYAHWIARYAAIAPRVRIDYQPVGSAAGVRQLALGMADVAASDAPVHVASLDLVHLPTAASAVAIVHHVPGLARPLRLGPRAVGAVFAGAVQRWDDAVIARDNPGVALPALPIVPVHRADGSGATEVLTRWLDRHGALAGGARPGLFSPFTSGLAGRGSNGVSGIVARVAGALGYVEIGHARAAGLDVVAVAAGDDDPGTLPDDDEVARATGSAGSEVAIGTEPPGATPSLAGGPAVGYPLTSFTYVLVRRDGEDEARASALARFLWWALGPGQEDCAPLGYHPLPAAIAARARAVLARDVSTGGRPALRID